MNIESILDKIDLFEDLVIESGFRRDIADYSQSISQAQNRNLVSSQSIIVGYNLFSFILAS
jgi:hypothetical protein